MGIRSSRQWIPAMELFTATMQSGGWRTISACGGLGGSSVPSGGSGSPHGTPSSDEIRAFKERGILVLLFNLIYSPSSQRENTYTSIFSVSRYGSGKANKDTYARINRIITLLISFIRLVASSLVGSLSLFVGVVLLTGLQTVLAVHRCSLPHWWKSIQCCAIASRFYTVIKCTKLQQCVDLVAVLRTRWRWFSCML